MKRWNKFDGCAVYTDLVHVVYDESDGFRGWGGGESVCCWFIRFLYMINSE